MIHPFVDCARAQFGKSIAFSILSFLLSLIWKMVFSSILLLLPYHRFAPIAPHKALRILCSRQTPYVGREEQHASDFSEIFFRLQSKYAVQPPSKCYCNRRLHCSGSCCLSFSLGLNLTYYVLFCTRFDWQLSHLSTGNNMCECVHSCVEALAMAMSNLCLQSRPRWHANDPLLDIRVRAMTSQETEHYQRSEPAEPGWYVGRRERNKKNVLLPICFQENKKMSWVMYSTGLL